MKSGFHFFSFRRFFSQAILFKKNERGIATGVFILGLFTFLAAGSLAIDISHQMTAGVELQNAADAAAAAGAISLDGTIGGITEAVDRAIATTKPITAPGTTIKANTYDFESAITLNRADVTFGVNVTDFNNGAAGYSEADAKLRAAAIRFIKVKIPMHYIKGVFTNVSIGKKFLGVTRDAVASMSPSGLLPASADAPEGTPPVLSDKSIFNTVCNWVPLSALQAPRGDGVTYTSPQRLEVVGTCSSYTEFTPGCTYVIKAGSNGTGVGFVAGGNFQALAALNPDGTRADTGGSDLRARIAGGVRFCIHPRDWVGTEPGENGGTVRQGLNARFGDYNGGLNAAHYPPDENVKEGITYEEYSAARSLSNRSGSNFQAPSQGIGVRNRRVIIIPIINEDQFNAGRDRVQIEDLGAFFLRTKVSNGGNADVIAEYLGGGYETLGIYNNPNFVPATPDNGGRIRGLSKATLVR